MYIEEHGMRNKRHHLAQSIVSSIYGLHDTVNQENFTLPFDREHRMEKVATRERVDFINDSKSTNVNSTWFAFESITKPIVWIAGGVDKGNDYTIIQPLVQKKAKALICLGSDNTKLHSAFRKLPMIISTESMEAAVAIALRFTEAGDCILLSPACASFDLFENYEDRGNKFKEIVYNL